MPDIAVFQIILEFFTNIKKQPMCAEMLKKAFVFLLYVYEKPETSASHKILKIKDADACHDAH